MKVCSRCKIEKDDSEFHRKRSELQDRCKECKRLSIREHYQANKFYYFEKAKAGKKKSQDVMREHKSKPCVDCKQSYPWYVMDFDHIDPNTKINDVSRMIGSSLKSLEEEIAKCEVVCSNCHRKRTFQRHQRIASVS